MEKMDLIRAVKQYALEHYERGGWDYIIECYDDREIAELIGNAKTVAGAIKNVRQKSCIGQRGAYRRDIQGA